MQVKQALIAGTKDPERRFRFIRGIGFSGLPTDVHYPILGGYFLGGLLVWVGSYRVCLNITLQQE
jgi:hypothetical protein